MNGKDTPHTQAVTWLAGQRPYEPTAVALNETVRLYRCGRNSRDHVDVLFVVCSYAGRGLIHISVKQKRWHPSMFVNNDCWLLACHEQTVPLNILLPER